MTAKLISIANLVDKLGVSRRTLHPLKSAGECLAPCWSGHTLDGGGGEIDAWVDAGCPARHVWETRIRRGPHKTRGH